MFVNCSCSVRLMFVYVRLLTCARLYTCSLTGRSLTAHLLGFVY